MSFKSRFLCLFLSVWPVLGESGVGGLGGLKSPNITGLELSPRSNRISFIKLNSPVFGVCLLVRLSFDEYEVTFLFYFWLEIILSDIRMATIACLLGLSSWNTFFHPFTLWWYLSGGDRDRFCFLIQSASLHRCVRYLVSGPRLRDSVWHRQPSKGAHRVPQCFPWASDLGRRPTLTQDNAQRYKGLCNIGRWKLWTHDGDGVWCRLKPAASQVVLTSQRASHPGRMSTLTQGQTLTLRGTLGLHHGSPTIRSMKENNSLYHLS